MSDLKKGIGGKLCYLIILSLMAYAGCSGGSSGGGGGGAPAGQSGTQGAGAGTAAVSSALNIAALALNPGGLSNGKQNTNKLSTSQAVKSFIQATRLPRKTTTAPCSSGSESVAATWAPPVWTTQITANNCIIDSSIGSVTTNGSITVKQTDTAFTGDPTVNSSGFNPSVLTLDTGGGSLSFTTKDTSGNVTDATSTAGSMTVNRSNPDSNSRFQDLALDGTLTLTTQDPTKNKSVSLQSLQATVHIAGFGSNTSTAPDFDQPTDSTTTLVSGSVVVVDNLNSANDVTATFNNLIAHELITYDSSGNILTDTLTLSGGVTTSCHGALTVATPTPLNIDTTIGCPVAGEITVTGSSGVATITFTSTGGVNIVNPDGSTSTLTSCQDAKAC